MPAQDVITLALRSTTSIEHVVKAALALADEVGDLEASAWLNEELHGYAFADRAPEYRRLLPAPAYRIPIASGTDAYAQGFWAPEHADFGKERVVILQSIPDLLKLRAANEEQVVLQMPVPRGYIVNSEGKPQDGYQTWTLKSLRPILSGVRARAMHWAQDVAKRTPKASRSPSTAPRRKRATENRVFIVHGHNHAVRDAIDLYLTKDLGVRTLVMQAGASGGRTIPITADLGQTKLQLKNELQKAGIVA